MIIFYWEILHNINLSMLSWYKLLEKLKSSEMLRGSFILLKFWLFCVLEYPTFELNNNWYKHREITYIFTFALCTPEAAGITALFYSTRLHSKINITRLYSTCSVKRCTVFIWLALFSLFCLSSWANGL